MRGPLTICALTLLFLLVLCIAQGPRSSDRARELAPVEEQDPACTPLLVVNRSLPRPQLERRLPEPIKEGPCAVFLRLVDARTEEVCQSKVQLWRLDAPASDTMSRGDQRVRRFDVPFEGLRVEALAAGRYRLVVEASARHASDPVAFDVTSLSEEIVVRVVMPTTITLSLALYDLAGNRLREAELRADDREHSEVEVPVPRWSTSTRAQRLREPRTLEERIQLLGGLELSDLECGRSFPWRILPYVPRTVDSEGWFALGPFAEGTRRSPRPVSLSVLADGVHGASNYLLHPSPDHSHWVSVVCDRAYVLAALRLPDGRDGWAIAARVTIRPQALPVTPGGEQETVRWRDVPIDVAVARTDGEPVRFTFMARDLPLAERLIE